MAYEYTNKIKLAFCFTIVLLLQGCPPFGNDLPNSFRQSNHTPAPTGGWAVCYTTGLRFSINAGAGGNPGGRIGGPFEPAPTPAVPPGPTVPAPSSQPITVVSRVFQWSGATSNYSTQFDQYLATAVVVASAGAAGVGGLPAPPSHCDFEATIDQVFENGVFTDVNWPMDWMTWPTGSLPQGWASCYIEPPPTGSKIYTLQK